ncbi:hypothetical protein IT084_05395 [Desulfallas sp. Bu1-1]|uniref:hypothetical protein n=1 Tax=Desulfallas sp. Bu1-1 TaxID=2787620 RepID=UPI00189DE22B|nr:hypothetical protein [Desulfallas sp. Bu1-1]MBF7082413.1 hypothetical protein [Desulfallas sp. Bu1-1]
MDGKRPVYAAPGVPCGVPGVCFVEAQDSEPGEVYDVDDAGEYAGCRWVGFEL